MNTGLAQDASQTLVLPPNATVWMCPGQGSQRLGMGADLLDLPQVAASFACASDVLHKDLVAIIKGEDQDLLNETSNAQACISALTLGVAAALEEEAGAPDALIGFSLGQISALGIAGMLSWEDMFRLIEVRGQAMSRACTLRPGCMSALIKADAAAVEALCQECAQGQVLVPANYNCPGQIVISGEADAVCRAEEAWSAQGGRSSRLATSGAFHSPLMAEAAEELASYLTGVRFEEPRIAVVCNTDASPLTQEDAADRLVAHLVSPVLFEQSVVALQQAGATRFVEVGFGGVLAGLVRRVDKSLERACVQDAKSYREYCGGIHE